MVKQAIKVDEGHDSHINTQPQEFNKAQKSKDESGEIKIGSLAYRKPQQLTGNVTPGVAVQRYSVMDIKKDVASVQWLDPSDNNMRYETIPVSELTLEQPK